MLTSGHLHGETVAGYALEAVIGRGGMGVVYLAEAPDGSKAAVKLLSQLDADDDTLEERFLREVRLAQTIEHPNIVPVYAAGEDTERLYLAMRYIPGGDLTRLLLREGALAPERTVALIRDIAGALDAAHDRGLVHRDVKPGNILVDDDGGDHPYLSDFGLAKRRDDTVTALSRSGQMIGTVDYMAPEQVRGQPIDRRVDTYALGCVAFQCLTGSTPYSGSDVAVMWQKLNEPPPRVSERDASLARFDDVVAKALADDPRERFQTAGELAAALEAALHQQNAPANSKRAFRRGWRRRATIIAGACAIAALSTASAAPSARIADAAPINLLGHKAPDLQLQALWTPRSPAAATARKAISAGTLDLRRLRGRPIVLTFWGCWNLYICANDAPLLGAAATSHERMTFLGVDLAWKGLLPTRAFLRRYSVPFVDLYDASRQNGSGIDRAYGITGIPTTFFIDARGVVVDVVRGTLSERTLHRGLALASR